MCYALLYFHGVMFIVTCISIYMLRAPIMTAIKIIAPIVRPRLNTTHDLYAHTLVKEEEEEEELPPDTEDEASHVAPMNAMHDANLLTKQRAKLKFT